METQVVGQRTQEDRRNRASVRKNAIGGFLSAALIVTALYLLVQRQYILSDFIYGLDDAIHLPRAWFGEPHIGQYPHVLIHTLVTLLAPLGSLVLLKVLPLMAVSLCTGLVALMLVRYVDWRLAIVFGVFCVSVPVNTSLVVFVIGAHPIFALLPVLAALALFDRGYSLHGWQFVFMNAAVMLLLLGAIFGSPSGRIAVLAHPIWLGLAWISSGTGRKQYGKWAAGLLTAVVVGVAGYLLVGLPDHHYTTTLGWVDISPAQVLNSLESAAWILWRSTLRTSWGILYLAGAISLALLLAWVLIKRENTVRDSPQRDLLVLGLNSLVASALLFGPGSVVTDYASRYMVGPLVLSLVAVFAIGYAYLPVLQHRSRYVNYVAAVLAFVTTTNFVLLQEFSESQLKWRLDSHDALAAFIEAERGDWPDDAQVVMLLEDSYSTTTVGFNHWSTWYVRLLANNPDMLGLIGDVDMISHFPFIEQYADHDIQFWEIVAGRSRRIPMMGLEYDRPTFVYHEQNAGFVPVDYLVVTDNGETHYVGYGLTYQESAGIELVDACAEAPLPLFFVWDDEAAASQDLCATS